MSLEVFSILGLGEAKFGVTGVTGVTRVTISIKQLNYMGLYALHMWFATPTCWGYKWHECYISWLSLEVATSSFGVLLTWPEGWALYGV